MCFTVPGTTRFDSALVVETLRQLTVLVAHTQLGVPLNRRFLMPGISVSMTAGARRDPMRPSELTAQVQVSEVRWTGQEVAALRTVAVFLVNGQRIARGTARARIIDPDVYMRIRSRRPVTSGPHEVAPVPAASVGHTSAWNVVLGETGTAGLWPLRVDISNPILFDHLLDHVPGTLLIEAVRQALRLAVSDPALDPMTFEADFLSIAELGDKATVVLESMAHGVESTTAVATIQANGRVLMRAAAGITPTEHFPVADRGLQPKPGRTGPAGPRGNLHA